MTRKDPQVWPEFEFFRYELPLNTPLQVGSQCIDSKAGLLVRCHAQGLEGWGDIAPLDGYSAESLHEVLGEIKQVRRDLKGLSDLPATLPSLRCGLEFALAAFRAACRKTSLFESLGGHAQTMQIRVARLLQDGDAGSLCAYASAAVKEGFTVIKCKVGRRGLEEDLTRIRELCGMLPSEVLLRLDANRAWTLDEALRFSRALDPARIEYLEEPLQCWDDYGAFGRGQELPYALDESLVGRSFERVEAMKGLKAVVIKPSLLGGLEVSRGWMGWATARGLIAVVSSMYESGVGQRGLLALAGAASPTVVAGLDTGAFLADDVTIPQLVIRDGCASLSDSYPGSWRVDVARITRLS